MSSTIDHTMGARDWMLLVSLSLLWGGSFFLIELAITVDALSVTVGEIPSLAITVKVVVTEFPGAT